MATILVVDDEKPVRDTFWAMLHNGHDVLLAAGTREADGLLASGQAIDLLVVDLSLPGESGIDYAIRLREQRPALPVLIISGTPLQYWGEGQRTGIAELRKASCQVLDKPFRVELLRSRMENLLLNSATRRRTLGIGG